MTTTTTAGWLDEQQRTTLAALGIPADRLTRAGDPYLVPAGMREHYAAALTGTPLVQLANLDRGDGARTRVAVAEMVAATLDPATYAPLGRGRGNVAPAVSMRQLARSPEHVVEWADELLARHDVDVDTYRRHARLLDAAGRRADRARAAERERARLDAEQRCAAGGHLDVTTWPRRLDTLDRIPHSVGGADTVRLCDRHAAAVLVELGRRAAGPDVSQLVDRLYPGTVPTPADVAERRPFRR